MHDDSYKELDSVFNVSFRGCFLGRFGFISDFLFVVQKPKALVNGSGFRKEAEQGDSYQMTFKAGALRHEVYRPNRSATTGFLF